MLGRLRPRPPGAVFVCATEIMCIRADGRQREWSLRAYFIEKASDLAGVRYETEFDFWKRR